MSDQNSDIQMLTEKERVHINKSINRMKRCAILTNDVQFVTIYFRPNGAMHFTESDKMVIVK